jgi:hypothetical protein
VARPLERVVRRLVDISRAVEVEATTHHLRAALIQFFDGEATDRSALLEPGMVHIHEHFGVAIGAPDQVHVHNVAITLWIGAAFSAEVRAFAIRAAQTMQVLSFASRAVA